jgi:RNA polymerase sigma factor (sigma-70 family)
MCEFSELSDREREVILILAQGKQNKEIARQLGISEHTVEKHLSNIYRKLNVANRAEATALFWLREHFKPDK